MKTAAEWLEESESRYRDCEDDSVERRVLLAMLRDAKAELEKAMPLRHYLDCQCTFGPDGETCAACRKKKHFRGWDAIEAKWQSGGYR